jgi:pimeloyl-ACP methyl ester carboxylesterase
MKLQVSSRRWWFAAAAVAAASLAHADSDSVRIEGAVCATPPPMHCPDNECSGPMVVNQGSVVEMKTRRTYFLDYPCDLKAGEKVMFVLNLHGGGSYGNWQRNYFPAMDYKEKYRVVVATPNSPIRVWSDVDDGYLQNIVDFVVAQIGKDNIKSFWLAGHSQGGMTSNRLIRTDYFKQRVDGFISLSGGRIGGQAGRASTFGVGRPGAAPPPPPANSGAPSMTSAMAALRQDPDGDFSFIFSTGRREMDDKGFPEASSWAAKYGCGAKLKRDDIVDTKAGYVYDSGRLNNMNPAWGLLPGPGKAEIFEYPNCRDGRVVADVQRMDKGHTEGYEPKITEELIKMMARAKGGKLQALK